MNFFVYTASVLVKKSKNRRNGNNCSFSHYKCSCSPLPHYKCRRTGETLEKYRMKDEICEKGYCGLPLTEEQKESNREKSRTRCRVEHIFGFMENTMNRLYIRTVGLVRATAVIGLINLTYNMSRYEQIVRLNLLKD